MKIDWHSNSLQRILAAIIMLLVLFVVIYLGKIAVLAFVSVIAVTLVHELNCNFFKLSLKGKHYIWNQLTIFLAIALAIYVFENKLNWVMVVIFALSLLLHSFLLYYLFFIPLNKKFLYLLIQRFPLLIPWIILPSLMLCVGLIIDDKLGSIFLFSAMIITVSTDTGAWFWGRIFGKRSLAPTISSNKTIEGFIGGIASALILTLLLILIKYWNRDSTWITVVIFILAVIILSVFSQMGDLIQSKLKREVGIKDSGNWIPGHGGLYDRLDALIFIIPFFIPILYYTSLYLKFFVIY